MSNGRLDKPVYSVPEQLTLTGIEAVVAEHEHLSMEEVRHRSESALAALSALRVKIVNKLTGETRVDEPRWMELYRRLREEGWPWRVAVYIAWAAQPRKYRFPETQEDLATQCLGLTSDRAIATWRKNNPAIDEYITMFQGSIIFDHLPDAYDAMVEVATSVDYKGHADRELMFEMAGVYTKSSKVTAEMVKRMGKQLDLSDLSDDELHEIVASAKSEADRRSEDVEDDDAAE